MRVRQMALILGVALAGCAPPQAVRKAPQGSVEVQPRVSGAAEATLPGTPAAVLERATTALQAQGLTVSVLPGPSGTVEATKRGAVDPAWVDCPTVTVRDPFSEAFRSRRKEAGGLTTRATVSAAAAAAGTSAVTVRALFLGDYVNDYTGNPQQTACRSTGGLERAILDALRGG